jgi:hypothetical protein
MRSLLVTLPLFIFVLFPALPHAAERSRDYQTYHGYTLELSAVQERQDITAITDTLRRQLDLVESVGLSTRVLNFFHTLPIVVDEAACMSAEDQKLRPAACYGPFAPLRPQHIRGATYWDNDKGRWINQDTISFAEDTKLGLVMVRPSTLYASSPEKERPVLLHELLHAYHAHMLPNGFNNAVVLSQYKVGKGIYPSDSYLMANEREFFAVTASVFLYGKETVEPFTRAKIREKQPEYYNYLVWMFGFDPDQKAGVAPLASAQ